MLSIPPRAAKLIAIDKIKALAIETRLADFNERAHDKAIKKILGRMYRLQIAIDKAKEMEAEADAEIAAIMARQVACAVPVEWVLYEVSVWKTRKVWNKINTIK